MLTTSKRRRLSAEQRRSVVLTAATEVFAAQGFAGASIREIARTAGVTIPVLYDHFASKRHLHVELLEREGDALIAAVSAVGGNSAEALMRHSVEAFFVYVEQHHFAWRMLFRDPPADADIAAAHARLMSRARAAITDLFRLTPIWITSSGLSSDQQVEILAEGTMAAINGLATWWWDHRELPRDEIVNLAMDLLFVGIERLRAPG